MNSNYPRSEIKRANQVKPRIWQYSVGLGLVIYLVGQIYAFTESTSNFLGLRVPRLDSDILFLPALLVASLGVVLLIKCTKWRPLDKAKMLGLTVLLMHTIAFALFLVMRWPDFAGAAPQYGMFLVVTVYFAGMLIAGCLVIWLLAAVLGKVALMLRPKQTLATESLKPFAEPFVANTVSMEVEEAVVQA